MATITIDDAVLSGLAAKAAGVGVTVEALLMSVAGTVEATGATGSGPLTGSARKRAIAEWKRVVRARSDRYPSGFSADIGREALYAERTDGGR